MSLIHENKSVNFRNTYTRQNFRKMFSDKLWIGLTIRKKGTGYVLRGTRWVIVSKI